MDRTLIEKDLIFCGFYICESPLKPDTKQHIATLMASNFPVNHLILGHNDYGR